MQPAKTTKYLCLFLCGICSDYTLRNQGAVWACVKLFLRLGKLSHKSNVGGDVATRCL